MLAASIARLWPWRGRRLFDALQVEVTTHCFLRCSFCPHEALGPSWVSRHMPMALFERLLPDLPLARFVHLQGWGEPLLHPDLLRMVEMAKSVGCQVGLTTSAVLLKEGVARRLLGAGLDLVAVSIAGASPSTHGAIRVGSHLPSILDNLAALSRLKKQLDSKRPKIVLLFMMLEPNLQELPAAADLAHQVGAQELVATNLDYLACAEHRGLRAFSEGETDGARLRLVEEAKSRAAELGIAFRSYPLGEQDGVLACEAMATPTAVVAADGGLFPCVYLSVPADPIPRLFRGEPHPVARRPLGSLLEMDLRTIWEGKEFWSFRRAFELRRRLVARLSLDQMLGGEVRWDPAGSAGREESLLDQLERGTPLPAECRGCYKAYGL